MITFLIHILDANPLMKDSDIVLINTAIDTDIESMHENPRLKHVKFIRGEYFLEVNLKRAAPERATKILILADATPGPNGKIPTITEADARTIMTAMALNNIAKGIPMAAEIIDSAMDQYLKLAHVSEIIYSRDYSRMLLAMASSGTGITNVFHDLLSPHSQSYISTKPIQHDFIGKKYGELKEHFFKESKNETLIGILENSGNSQVAKEAALKRAQLTPNISELVKNLQGVKALRFNNPYFNPDNDYLLSEGAMAIVIESRIGELKI